MINQSYDLIDPKLVFFSGGTALNPLARTFVGHHIFTTHIVSVFDDGGSTGTLRNYFRKIPEYRNNCIAIGDIRNRLLALSDKVDNHVEAAINLFDKRLKKDKPKNVLEAELCECINYLKSSNCDIEKSNREHIANLLSYFMENVSSSFNFRGASIGNLILYAKFMLNKDWLHCINWVENILNTCGKVLPATTESRFLVGIFKNGNIVFGQKNLTKSEEFIRSKIDDIYLCRSYETSSLQDPAQINKYVADEILKAKCLILSWGSFYTSILPNILVDGVREVFLKNNCPKILMVNAVTDLETCNISILEMLNSIDKIININNTISHLIVLVPENGANYKEIGEKNITKKIYRQEDKFKLKERGVRVNEINCKSLVEKEALDKVVNLIIDIANG